MTSNRANAASAAELVSAGLATFPNTQIKPAVADSKSLRRFGFLFSAVTAAVILFGGALVHLHADPRWTLDDAGYHTGVLSSHRLG